MKTLIELYDERPIENVLGTEVFRPEETVLLCPPEIASEHALKETYKRYFAHRGVPVKVTIVPVSLLDAGKEVVRFLDRVVATCEVVEAEQLPGSDNGVGELFGEHILEAYTLARLADDEACGGLVTAHAGIALSVVDVDAL